MLVVTLILHRKSGFCKARTAELITSGNVNPFDIDPEQTTLITTNAGVAVGDRLLQNSSIRLLENGSFRVLEGSGTGDDPFDIDPEQTTLITSGLTSSD